MPRVNNNHIYVLVTLGILLIFVLTFASIKNLIKQTEQHIKYQEILFEDEVKGTIEFYKLVMLALAKNLETVSLDNEINQLNKVLNSFKPLGEHSGLIKLNSFIIIDKNNNSIASSNMRWGSFKPLSYQGSSCTKGVRENPYQLMMGSIIYGRYSHKLVIPLGMGFNDKQGQYSGSICTGLIIEDLIKEILNKALDNTISVVNISFSPTTELNNDKIALQNSNEVKNHGYKNGIEIFFKLFSQDKIIFTHQLALYPYKLELILNKKSILLKILGHLILSLVYVIIIFIIYYYIKKYLLKPLSHIVDETTALAKQYNILSEISNEGYNAGKKENYSITLLYSFIINVKTLLDLKDKEEKRRITEYKEKLFEEQKLKMMLLARHYDREPESLIGDISADYIIKSHIKQFVKGDNSTIRIGWFINEIKGYLQDILDISIVIKVAGNIGKQKVMIDKYGISQILYNIFSFVAYFDQTDKNQELVLQYSIEPHCNKLQFTILIPLFKEMPAWSSDLNSFYQHYNYHTLYTIYKLAELNGYALFISEDNDYLYFKLAPYEVVLNQDLKEVNWVFP